MKNIQKNIGSLHVKGVRRIKNMITIYFDGLCKPHPGGVATYGYVIYQDGKTIKKGCRVIGEGEGMTVNVAEYSALKRALEWLNEQGINDDIVVKGDSMLVINQMKGLYRIKSKTSKFFVPIIQKLLERKKICFVWIPREENMEADMLSNVAYKRYMLKIALCKAVFVAHKAG